MHLIDPKIKGNDVWTNRSYFTVMIMSDFNRTNHLGALPLV